MMDKLSQLHNAGLHLRAKHGESMAKEAILGAAIKGLGKAGLKGGANALGWLFQPGKAMKRAGTLATGATGLGFAGHAGIQAAKNVSVAKRGPAPPTYAA